MSSDAWITLGILAAAIFLFVTEWLRVDVVAIGVVISLMLTGILEPEQALSGFSNEAVLSIAALFIVGGAILQTGLATIIGNRILKIAGTDEKRLILVIMVAVSVLSSFMSSTGTVAVLLPAIISLAATTNISPAKLLIPLSFGSLLGGATTLIGTPPNLIASDLLEQNGLEPFDFFEFTPIGVALVIVGVIFMVTVGRFLLPEHEPAHGEVQLIKTPQELIDVYRLPDNLFRLRVRSKSPLIGKTIQESRIGHDFDVSVLEILRPAQPRTVARIGEQRLMFQSGQESHIHPTPETILARDDVLIVRGEGADIGQVAAVNNLAIQAAEAADAEALVSSEIGMAEVVLPPRSTLIGKTLPEVRFGSTYHLTVLDIRRPGSKERLDLKETPLAFGDTLLVQGEWRNIVALQEQRRDFIVIAETSMYLPNRKKAPMALLVLLGMLILIVSGLASVVEASMLAGIFMVITGCLTMDKAYEAIDWKSLVLIAGMWPMSIALTEVGVVDRVAVGFTDTLGSLGPLVVMAGLFLMTAVFSQVLSNTATTVIIAPIAFATAQELAVSPYAFLMAVAVAASMAFASPVASPVNTLVMGAGNYSFGDYAKVGIPLILLSMVVTLIVLPILFPF
jgi:di/tricarboxylate transporter